MENSKRGVLVVDDEADFRRVLCDFLRDHDYQVLEASDGASALEIYNDPDREIEIDLVITDFRMPRMGGEALIRELRRFQDYLPILGITGHQELSDQIKVLAVGGFYFLEKPLPAWPIVERIVDTAVRLFLIEKELREARAKELEIARLLRTYVLKNPVEEIGANICFQGGISLEIEVLSVDVQRPGGDLIEWFRPTPSEMVFYLADAMGHDLVACFIACMNSMVTHRTHHGRRPSIEQLVTSIDHAVHHLCTTGSLDSRRHFLTLFLGCINLEFGELRYVNAGHPDAFVVRPGRGVRRLGPTFRPIGLPFPGHIGVEFEYLRPGDLLFLYTDGVFDVLSQGAPKQGMQSLESLVAPLIEEPASVIVREVDAALRKHLAQLGISDFNDDTTLVAMKVLRAEERSGSIRGSHLGDPAP
jgi:sigma-B regulation protein RsbU (phosphoserine phosphatase)